MKPLLLVTGPVTTRSGYGSHSRDLVRALVAMDRFDLRINSMRWGNTPMNALNDDDPNDKLISDRIIGTQVGSEWNFGDKLDRQPDVHIQVSVPNEFMSVAKYNIGITAGIENTAPVPAWIQGMNRMDLNIVPSNFVKQVFEKTVYQQKDAQGHSMEELKMEKPIEVLFEGADMNIYKKTKEISEGIKNVIDEIPEKFVFLYTGHWLAGNLGEDRKDTGMMLKTFLETFKNQKNPPAILMKTSGATFSIMDRNEIKQKIDGIKDSVKGTLPNVYVLHGNLTDKEMNEMYNHPKVKAHVSFTHGEGFGRPLLEASLSEKPIMASNWSGHLDFLNKNQSVLLPGGMTPVPKAGFSKEMLQEGAEWFTVNYQYASRIMLDMHKNYRKYTLNAKKLGIVNRGKFSMKAMTKKFEDILNQYLPKFEEQPQPVQLNLPKLKKVNSSPNELADMNDATSKQGQLPTLNLPKLKRV